VFGRGGAAAQVSGAAWLQAMLDFEGALARANAACGLIPGAAAETISAACSASRLDAGAIGSSAASGGNPAIPLVAELRAKLPSDVAGWVHFGATSQDVIDTAAMLVARRAIAPILGDALRAASACATLADAHRDTIMIGRTLLQQAVPTVFGLKAAGWLAGIVRARRELVRALESAIALQFGGAAGTLASLGDDGLRVAASLAAELALTEPALPWHTERTRIVGLVAALGLLTGALGKVARDVVLLSQNEVAEVRSGQGGSSTMPHKRNPVPSVAVLACAQRLPGVVASLSLVHEHERAAGAWHAEWEPFSEAIRVTGSAAAWAAEMLEELEVDGEQMRRNLSMAGDGVMAESLVMTLAARVGLARARALVEEALGSGDVRTALAVGLAGELSPEELDAALSPERYLGSAHAFIDRALAEYGAGA
jgi:3-carboxy-cis,cis-muconate cycloisomerase